MHPQRSLPGDGGDGGDNGVCGRATTFFFVRSKMAPATRITDINLINTTMFAKMAPQPRE